MLAVPRGGVPIGAEIAKELGLPMEIILSKKIGHPYNPEYAIGSVSLQGTVIDESVTDIPMSYIRQETDRILEDLRERFKLFMGERQQTDLKGKIALLVDDGIATGNTLLASIKAIEKHEPEKIVVAIPVAPATAIKRISKVVDEVICLLAPENFMGVGQFYKDFSQTSDEEVIMLLEQTNRIKYPF